MGEQVTWDRRRFESWSNYSKRIAEQSMAMGVLYPLALFVIVRDWLDHKLYGDRRLYRSKYRFRNWLGKVRTATSRTRKGN